MTVSPQDVEKVALLARLAISESDLPEVTERFGRVLRLVDELNFTGWPIRRDQAVTDVGRLAPQYVMSVDSSHQAVGFLVHRAEPGAQQTDVEGLDCVVSGQPRCVSS